MKENKKIFILYFIFFIVLAIGLLLRLRALDLAFINEWAARDFDRAINLIDGNYFPLVGPEYDNGGRLPGPFLYLLLALPLMVNYSYDSLIIFNFIINAAGMGLFFWAIKKYFDLQIAIISGTIILIFLPHIQNFGFPINPAFIFFFIALLMGLLLELIINKNFKCFPLIFLTLSLSVQLHFSMAVFYAVPFVILIVYRIKIPWTYFFWTAAIVLICFSPLLFYKEFYLASPTWTSKGTHTIKGFDLGSYIEIFRAIIVNKTVARLTDFNGLSYWVPFSKTAVLIYKVFIYCCLGYLIFHIFKKGYRNTKREVIALSCFYVPALIYEVIHPKYAHNWYSFIFIFPIFLISGISVKYFYDSLREKQKLFFPIGLVVILVILIFDAFQSMGDYQKKVYGNSYRFSKKIFGGLMKNLKLNPEEFAEKVYLDFPILPHSVKRLSFAKPTIDYSGLKNNNSCFYIIDANYISGTQQNTEPLSRLKNIFQEKVINVQFITFSFSGTPLVMEAYEYLPVYQKNCYQNIENFFQVSKRQWNLLRISRTLDDDREYKGAVNFKLLESERKFSKNSELIFLNEKYVVLDKIIKLPVFLELKIEKTIRGNMMQVKIDGYNYGIKGEIPKFSFSLLKKEKNIRGQERDKEILMSLKFNPLFQNKLYTTKFNLTQDFLIPENIELKKNKFDLIFNWEPTDKTKNDNTFPKSYLTEHKIPLITQQTVKKKRVR